jgi:hypothetical protein
MHGAEPNFARASSSPGSFSPSPVPLSGSTVFAAVRSRSLTPGRSGRRELVIAAQASESGSTTAGAVSGFGTCAGTSLAPISTSRTRETVAVVRSGPMTASMMPFLCRFSPVCTLSGNFSP